MTGLCNAQEHEANALSTRAPQGQTADSDLPSGGGLASLWLKGPAFQVVVQNSASARGHTDTTDREDKLAGRMGSSCLQENHPVGRGTISKKTTSPQKTKYTNPEGVEELAAFPQPHNGHATV